MAVSTSHGAFIIVAMALYLIQMVLMRKKRPSDEHIEGGGGEVIDEPSGSINLSDDTYIDFTGNFPIIDNTSLEVVVVESGVEQGRSNVIITS